jgi:hypothetical protein
MCEDMGSESWTEGLDEWKSFCRLPEKNYTTQCDSPARGQVGSGTMLLSRAELLPLNGPAFMTKHNPSEMRLQQAIVFLLTIEALSVIHELQKRHPLSFPDNLTLLFPLSFRGLQASNTHTCSYSHLGPRGGLNDWQGANDERTSTHANSHILLHRNKETLTYV